MYLNFPNPPMPPTSTEAPSQAEVTGRTLKRWGIDQAAVAAKAAVGCASKHTAGQCRYRRGIEQRPTRCHFACCGGFVHPGE